MSFTEEQYQNAKNTVQNSKIFNLGIIRRATGLGWTDAVRLAGEMERRGDVGAFSPGQPREIKTGGRA